jgi:hypothetical protein
MNDCQSIRDLLVLHAEGQLSCEAETEVKAHLSTCSACRRELAGIEEVRSWLKDEALFAPEEDYAWQLLAHKVSERASQAPAAKPWLPSNLGALGWTLSMAATFILACGLLWLYQRPVSAPLAPAELAKAEAPGNQAFLEKMQSAYAKEVTSEYLLQCQDLLLNVMRAGKGCNGQNFDVSLEVTRARDLLRQKRMLDQELNTPDVASARRLCDELENFLIHLSTSDKCESPDKLHRMERFIQREQLLLRINVLQAELS